jgi:transposase
MLRRRMLGMLARNRHLVRQLRHEQALRARFEARVKELEQAAARRPTASNSSLPPSANPIGARPPVVKRPTGRKAGGQSGHPGKSRTLLPTSEVDQVVVHRPAACGHCRATIDPESASEVAGRHQVAELPPRAVVIIEHRSLACRCGRCGRVTRGTIPADVQASCTGPRLSAAVALLGASLKGSRRAVAQTVAEVLGCPTALGSVCAREKELCDALEAPYRQLVGAAAGSRVKYVDETGWKLKGKARWLFVAADADQTVFRVEKARTRPGLRALLGGGRLRGVFCTDRAGIYDALSLSRRGLCWAHLKRDFVAAIERGGAGEAMAVEALAVCREMFELWHRFKKGEIGRGGLKEGIEPLRRRMRAALESGAACGQKKTAGLCRALLKREPALWRFAKTPGLEPTNNLAERMLRPAVIWRKKSFGSWSQGGCRYVERVLSVLATLRQRGRPTLAYLADAIAAHRKGEDAPAIAPTPAPAAQHPSAADPLAEQVNLRKVA